MRPEEADERKYFYEAEVLRVVDGDTLDLRVDVGHMFWTRQRYRLNDFNAPETRGPESACGEIATLALKAFVKDTEPRVWVRTHKRGSFGRYLIDLYAEDALGNVFDVVERLIGLGFGVAWPGGRDKRPTPWLDPEVKYPLGTR